MNAVPWARPDLFLPLPAEAGPWGVARSDQGKVVFEQLPDADALRRRVREDQAIYYAWTPGATNLRLMYEIPETAAEVEARGGEELRRDLRKSMPWFAGTVLALAATVAFWSNDRERQFPIVLFLMFGVLPMWRKGVEAAFEAWRSVRRLKRDPGRWRALESSRVRFASWAGDRSSRVAAVIVGALVVTFLAMWRRGEAAAIAEFALDRRKVLAGEWWRLLSCVFLHGGPMHLFFNCAAWFSLASMARSLVSEAHILGAFAASAVAGSLASAFLRSGGTSVGASGAILGLGGLMLGLALAHRELRPTGLISNLMRWIALLVLIGVAGMNFIDNAAHAGGLAMGVAIGLFIARDSGRPLPVEWRVKRAGWVVVAVLAGAPWVWMLWKLLG